MTAYRPEIPLPAAPGGGKVLTSPSAGVVDWEASAPVPPTDPAANVAGLRTLGTGAQQALPGNTVLSVPDATFVAQVAANGVTDDTAAWNTAISAAIAAGGGSVVPSRYGSCVISGTGLLLNANQHVRVDGYGIKLLPTIGATCITVDAAGSGGSAVGGEFSGFVIDAQGRSNVVGVFIQNSERIRVRDMNIQNCGGTNGTGIILSNKGVTATAGDLPTGNGVGYVEDCHFENIYIASCARGIDFQSSYGSNVSVEENSFHHIGIAGCTTGIRQAAGLEFRTVWMQAIQMWATPPGSQTCIELNGDLTDWYAQLHLESLNAASGQTGIHATSTATNVDLAHVDLGFGGVWANKFVVDPGTVGFRYQMGRDFMMGGKSGGQPIRFMRETDTQPRLRVDISPATLSFGAGGATTVDTTVSREAASVLALGADDVLKTGKNVTGSRPSAVTVGEGAQFFDTTLHMPIWSNGTIWVKADGTAA